MYEYTPLHSIAQEREWGHPRGSMSTCGNGHLHAQVKEGSHMILEATPRMVTLRPHHFCTPRCETRKCRKPEAVSLDLGQRIRDFPQQAIPLQREMKMFLGKRNPGHHRAQVAVSMGLGVASMPHSQCCVTVAEACALSVSWFPYLRIFIKSASQEDVKMKRDNKGEDHWKKFN